MIRVTAPKEKKLFAVFMVIFLAAIWAMIRTQDSYAETTNRKFTVAINGPDMAETGKQTSLAAQVNSGSKDTAQFEWKQIEGPAIKQSPAGDQRKSVFSFTPREPGQYRFSVSVTKGRAQASAEKTVTAVPSTGAKPEASAASTSASPLLVTINAYPQIPYASQKLTLAASAQGGPESNYTYTWKQIEGETISSLSGWNGNLLILPQGVLRQGIPYVFRVTVNSGLATGLAVFRVVPQ